MNFFKKLVKEGKLGLVNASEEVKQAYINKSESNLISAKILLKNERLEESISLAYYSMYNLILALFYKTGIKCENHTASILLLKQVFYYPIDDISFAKKERVDKQYYFDFKIARKDVDDLIRTAENFNSKILNFISKINTKDVITYREKFSKII